MPDLTQTYSPWAVPIYGGGGASPYSAPPPFAQQMGMFGSLLGPGMNMGAAAMGGVPMSPFGSVGGYGDWLAQARQQQVMTTAMANVSPAYDVNMLQGLLGAGMVAGNGGVLTPGIAESARRQAEMASSALNNPMIRMLLAQTGLDLSPALASGTVAAGTAALMPTLGMHDATGLQVAGYASTLLDRMYNPATATTMGSINARMSGMSPMQYMGAMRSLSVRGLLGRGDVSGAEGMGAFINSAGKTTESYLDAMGETQAIAGTEDPETLTRVMQTLTGGGMGRMDPAQLSQEMRKFKEISRAAGVAVEAMVGLVDSAVGMARQYNIDPMAASRLATGNILGANVAAGAMGTSITPGVVRDPMELYGVMQRSQFSAAKSDFAGRAASALSLLGDRIDDSPIGAALRAAQEGSLSPEQFQILRSPDAVAGYVAGRTGISAGRVRAALANSDVRAMSIAENPGVIEATAEMQMISTLGDHAGTIAANAKDLGLQGMNLSEINQVFAASMVSDERFVAAGGKGKRMDVRAFALNINGEYASRSALILSAPQRRAAMARASAAAEAAGVLKVALGGGEPALGRFLSSLNQFASGTMDLGEFISGGVLGSQSMLGMQRKMLEGDHLATALAGASDPAGAARHIGIALGIAGAEDWNFKGQSVDQITRGLTGHLRGSVDKLAISAEKEKGLYTTLGASIGKDERGLTAEEKAKLGPRADRTLKEFQNAVTRLQAGGSAGNLSAGARMLLNSRLSDEELDKFKAQAGKEDAASAKAIGDRLLGIDITSDAALATRTKDLTDAFDASRASPTEILKDIMEILKNIITGTFNINLTTGKGTVSPPAGSS